MEKKIVIIDDDKIICKVIARMFQTAGLAANPLIFYNGKDAFYYLEENITKNDYVVFLDINMPIMNGWQFLKKAKEKEIISEMKIFIITSSIYSEDHNKAEKNEFVEEILIKPITLQKVNSLKKVLT